MRVIVVGSYGVGMTMYVDRAPLAGETVRANAFAQGPGGKGSNQAIAARRLGATVELITIVGPDDLGESARRLWHQEGIDASAVLTGTAATMVGFILVEGNGENRIAIAPGALAQLTPGDVRKLAPRIRQADVVLTNLEISTSAAGEALRIAHEAGIPTVLDPAPATTDAAEILAFAGHITPNRIEAETITGLPPGAHAEDLVAGLRKLAPHSTVALTLGPDGVLVDEPDVGATRVPGLIVDEIVDTAGAGDAFSAAYAVTLSQGHSAVHAATMGAVAGAFAVTRREVVPGLPTADELRDLAQRAGVTPVEA